MSSVCASASKWLGEAASPVRLLCTGPVVAVIVGRHLLDAFYRSTLKAIAGQVGVAALCAV